MLNRIKKRHIVLLTLLSALTIVSIIYFQDDADGKTAVIRPYQPEKDFNTLVKIMNDNRFLLTERTGFYPEKILMNQAPTDEPEKKGLVKIDVIETDDTTAGFIAYYKKSREHGFIWLLAVGKEFRGRGLGEKLLAHALLNLKRQGATYATLATRLINKPALKLYTKMGFVETNRNEERGIITLINRNF